MAMMTNQSNIKLLMKIPKIEQLQHGRSIFTRFPVDLPKLQIIVTTERNFKRAGFRRYKKASHTKKKIKEKHTLRLRPCMQKKRKEKEKC